MTFQRLLSLLVAGACVQVYFAACQRDFIIDNRNSVGCTTRDGQSGDCIVLPKCIFAMNIIRKNGIASRITQNFLRPNQCGFDDNTPKVCCPNINGNPDDRHTSTEASNHIENSNNQVDGNKNNSNKDPLSLLPVQCGEDHSNRIIGGEKTELNEFPWMAVLEYQRGKQGAFIAGCGGALITRRYVLTAAHCIRAIPSTLRLVHVRLGEYDIRTDPDCVDDGNREKICADPVMLVPVEREIVHENYMRPEIYRNDIALLRLAIDVPTTRYIQPICLPKSSNTSLLYHAAGWGQVEFRPTSPIKLKVSLPYIDLDECGVAYRSRKVVLGDGQMCAGGKFGKDTCKGDSGGPLMKQIRRMDGPNRWVVDGLVSIGHSPCGLPGWPGVYTKVHNYVPWILSKLQP